MRFCYADPPYPGYAKKFYSHDPRCAEVDHAGLMVMLEKEFPSWALSTASVCLRDVLMVAPKDIRIAAWVKPFCSFKRCVNPAYAWEPVLFRTPNRPEKGRTIRDYVDTSITLKKGLTGAKPQEFSWWIFDLLGVSPDDEFVDLYPGTGGVMAAWEKWRNRKRGVLITGPLFPIG